MAAGMKSTYRIVCKDCAKDFTAGIDRTRCNECTEKRKNMKKVKK